MSLGIDKIEELKKELLEFVEDIAKIMEDSKVDSSDALAMLAAGKDGWDISSVVGEAWSQMKDLDTEEKAKCWDMVKEVYEVASKKFDLSFSKLVGLLGFKL